MPSSNWPVVAGIRWECREIRAYESGLGGAAVKTAFEGSKDGFAHHRAQGMASCRSSEGDRRSHELGKTVPPVTGMDDAAVGTRIVDFAFDSRHDTTITSSQSVSP